MGLSLGARGRIRYGKHPLLVQFPRVDGPAVANIVEKGALRGFELDQLAEDVQQVEKVVVERPPSS
jgi:hypothetical protein